MREKRMTLFYGPSASIYEGALLGRFNNHSVVDIVLDDMLYLVDPHWYRFEPLHPVHLKLLAIMLATLGTMSVTGNGMVIYIFSTTKSLRTPSNLLVVNLAVSDFLMMFCMVPPMVFNSCFETWVFGPAFCEVYGMFGSLFGCTSIWTMTMISLDRYNVIVKGLSAKPMTTKKAIWWIIFVWGISLKWTIFPVFGWSRYVPEGSMTTCGGDYLNISWISRSYVILYAVMCYFVPLAIIVYSYYYIVKAVAAHERNMREQAKKMNIASLRSADQQSSENKLAMVALMTISLWFMAWTPYLVINFVGVFGFGQNITPLSTVFATLFAKANAVYNPIVYGISHPKYRAALAKRFPRFFKSMATGSTETSEVESVQSVVTSVPDNQA
ncbi:hypothetical protein ONE63_007148 [Megalurothrips usitatus]|uniref:G-protein coupled receptors family 1 profile domain-containing protein n=1 Tax=Megalurothrips usitatus TaxID=439358 RepID=A0AAV7XVB8_9NEOP|nr:hypothetical protein ONE63_007148 [Megalurothrips usitatus]WRW34006.1 G-protein [Megalurothrips usitatus]